MKTLLSWSSGKDSAWTLWTLQKDPEIELCGLFTTLNEEYNRVAMHGVRREVLEAQAKAARLPLNIIPLPNLCSNEIYEERMGTFIEKSKAYGIEAMAFGDLFLEDIRAYREKQLEGTGIKPIFPIWGAPEDTETLSRKMIASGLRAKLSCVDSKQLAPEFSGRDYELELMNDLPGSVDPCGENGEFHTVVYDGPMFVSPLKLVKGESVDREGFVFTDFFLEQP